VKAKGKEEREIQRRRLCINPKKEQSTSLTREKTGRHQAGS